MGPDCVQADSYATHIMTEVVLAGGTRGGGVSREKKKKAVGRDKQL